MIFTPTPLEGSYVIQLSPRKDSRGWFVRTFCKDEFAQIGHQKEWVQTNHSCTLKKGTIRGMHYQVAPYQEIKMVRCIRGTVFDVIIDIRKGSSTFLQWYGIALSETQLNMLYIPEGFAHGFQTLTDNCELLYSHSELYVPGAENGIKYNDPLISITWPIKVTELSERDNNHHELIENFKGI